MRALCTENSVEHTQPYRSIAVWPDKRDSLRVLLCSGLYAVFLRLGIRQYICFSSHYYTQNVNTICLYFRRNDRRDLCLFPK